MCINKSDDCRGRVHRTDQLLCLFVSLSVRIAYYYYCFPRGLVAATARSERMAAAHGRRDTCASGRPDNNFRNPSGTFYSIESSFFFFSICLTTMRVKETWKKNITIITVADLHNIKTHIVMSR